MLAISWSFTPESGGGWNPEGTFGLQEPLEGPAAREESGYRAHSFCTSLKFTRPGLKARWRAGGAHFPALEEVAISPETFAFPEFPEIHSFSAEVFSTLTEVAR